VSEPDSLVRLRDVAASDGDFCLWLATTIDPHWWRISRCGPPTVESFRRVFPLGLEEAFIIEVEALGGARQPLGVCSIYDVEPEHGLAHVEVVLREDVEEGVTDHEHAAWTMLLEEVEARLAPARAICWSAAHLVPPLITGWQVERQAVLPRASVGFCGRTDVAVFSLTHHAR
jgi:hypothetical protein